MILSCNIISLELLEFNVLRRNDIHFYHVLATLTTDEKLNFLLFFFWKETIKLHEFWAQIHRRMSLSLGIFKSSFFPSPSLPFPPCLPSPTFPLYPWRVSLIRRYLCFMQLPSFDHHPTGLWLRVFLSNGTGFPTCTASALGRVARPTVDANHCVLKCL